MTHIFRPHSTPNQERHSDILGIHGTRGISEAESYSCVCSTALNVRNLAMSKTVSKTQKRLPKTGEAINSFKVIGVSVHVNKKVCGAVRARTNQPENGIASPGQMSQKFEKAPHLISC